MTAMGTYGRRRFKKRLAAKWQAQRNHDFHTCDNDDGKGGICGGRIVFAQSTGIGTCDTCSATHAHSKGKKISSYY
jgi:ribosomal protein L37AE/L43A